MPQFGRILLLTTFIWSWPVAAEYDLVLTGGRVMDPETGLDAIRNVAINGDRIAAIGTDDLSGKTSLVWRLGSHNWFTVPTESHPPEPD